MKRNTADIRVLMFGWELPPYNSGGLGVACLGLAKALYGNGVSITFVLPNQQDLSINFMDIKFAFGKDTQFSQQITYTTQSLYTHLDETGKTHYVSLLQKVQAYAQAAARLAKKEEFDIIHTHDWLTFGAGIVAQQISGKPLVSHVHATEFDRTGHNHLNETVYQIEKQGMQQANQVIAVSNFTKNIITTHYDIPENKVQVIHNGIDKPLDTDDSLMQNLSLLKKTNKVVLFVGRLTLQKGPDYFLLAAKKVLQIDPHVLFVIVGDGDMKNKLVQQTASMGISTHVIFTGFLRDDKLRSVYKTADLFVMPSVSEPFGITGLESAINGTPVLVSKQTGVSEVLTHALKVDFWDTDEMANKIISVINHKPLRQTLKQNGYKEADKLQWDQAAQKVKKVYQKMLEQHTK